ncbi:MAG: prefoldin subunit alpha [Promethearchaeota archaeon]
MSQQSSPLTPQEAQRKALLFQYLEREVASLESQRDFINNLITGIKITRQTIEELKKAEAGQEVVLPVGNSAFIKATVPDPSKLLVAVSNDVIIEQPLDKANDYTEGLLKKYEESRGKILEAIEGRVAQMNQLGPEIDEYVRRTQLQQQQAPGLGPSPNI